MLQDQVEDLGPGIDLLVLLFLDKLCHGCVERELHAKDPPVLVNPLGDPIHSCHHNTLCILLALPGLEVQRLLHI